jgi:hypothetical protein
VCIQRDPQQQSSEMRLTAATAAAAAAAAAFLADDCVQYRTPDKQSMNKRNRWGVGKKTL